MKTLLKTGTIACLALVTKLTAQTPQEEFNKINEERGKRSALIDYLKSEGKLKVKDLLIPKGLKKIPRIVEKTLLREDDPGNCDCVSDIVRGMVVLKHMCDVTTLLQALYECEEIEMTRMKERFERAPSDGVWMGFLPPWRVLGGDFSP